MIYRLDPVTSDLFVELVTHLSCVQVFQHIIKSSADGKLYATLTPHGPPQWQKQMTNCLAKFNIQHDLGGLAFTKTWGLADSRHLAATCITLHPGDMAEYTITSIERSTVVFGHQAAIERNASGSNVPLWIATESQYRDPRMICFDFVSSVLHFPRESLDKVCKKILYAAACIAISLPELDKDLIGLIGDALRWLAAHDGVNMDEELGLFTRSQQPYGFDDSLGFDEAVRINIPARRKGNLAFKGAQDVFEICEICGEGIGWYSLREAKCAAGHAFGM